MKIKFLISLAVCISLQLAAFAQQPLPKSADWQQYYKGVMVEISYRYADCTLPAEGLNEENVYLQFKNLSNKAIEVTYEIEAHYGNKCYNCEGGNKEYLKVITLAPNQTLAGDCTGIISGELKILSKLKNMPDLPVLKDFKVKNVSSQETTVK